MGSAGIELVFIRSWEEAKPGQMTWTNQGYIWYHMVSCSVCNCGSWPGGGGMTAWEQAEHWVSRGEQLYCASRALYILLLVLWLLFLLSLCCPIKLILSQFMRFNLFLPILLLIPITGEEWSSSHLVLSCWLGLNHDNLVGFNKVLCKACSVSRCKKAT